MTREIKFRAWDYQNNRWASQNDVAGSVGLVFGIKDYFINIAGEKAVRFSFQQYTGLNDKDGDEIYESDFVTVVNKSDYSKRIIEVKYEGGAFNICAFYKENGSLGSFYDVKKVGNVHEHPHLLTPTTELNKKL